MTLKELAVVVGDDLHVLVDLNGNWCVSFMHGEEMSGGLLGSVFGRGRTVNAAMQAFAKALRGKRMAFNAGNKERRREFNIPTTLVVEDGS